MACSLAQGLERDVHSIHALAIAIDNDCAIRQSRDDLHSLGSGDTRLLRDVIPVERAQALVVRLLG